MFEDMFYGISIVVAISGCFVALITLKGTLAEYARQGRQKRIGFYFQQEKALLENAEFTKIRKLLRSKDPADIAALREISKVDRSDSAGFFENIAMLIESDGLSEVVACYMFSHDAVLCWESDAFWNGFAKDNDYC